MLRVAFQRLCPIIAPTGVQHTSLPSLKISVSRLLEILYSQHNTNSAPISYLKPEKEDRNQLMLDRYMQGDTLSKIAKDFEISIARVHQIISRLI